MMSGGIPRKEIKVVTCPYCGKKRTYHYRAPYTEVDYSNAWPDREIPAWDDDKGCDCVLGLLEKTGTKISIRPQCANCTYQKNACCTSEEERESLTSQFGITGPLRIRDLNSACDYWKLSEDLFTPFLAIKKSEPASKKPENKA